MDRIPQPAHRQPTEYRKPVLTVFGAVGALTQAGSMGAAESTACMVAGPEYCGMVAPDQLTMLA